MPRQPACQQCNLKRKACDHQRPCQRCVKKKRKCIYPIDTGYQNANILRASRDQSETQLQPNSLSNTIPATTTTPQNLVATLNIQTFDDPAVLPVVAWPSNTPTALSAQHASGPSIDKAYSEQSSSTNVQQYNGSGNLEMADSDQSDSRSEQFQQRPDDSFALPQPISRQQRHNNSKRMRSEDGDSHQGSDSEASNPTPCQPCRDQRKGCDRTRPCSRCIKRGIPEDCISTIPKIKRRKLNSNVESTRLGVEESWKNSRAGTPSHTHSRPQRTETSTDFGQETGLAEPEQSVAMDRGQRQRQIRTQKPRPTPTSAPAFNHSQNIHASSQTTFKAMINPPSLPVLIRGRGRGLYIIPLDTLISQGQIEHQLAILNQQSLLALRQNNPPARGHFPRVLMDPSWSQPTHALPNNVNMLVHVPATEHGDFWALYAAPLTKTQGQKEPRTQIGDPNQGRVFWALVRGDILTLLRGMRALPRMEQLGAPTFLPGTRGFEVWRQAAEGWLGNYRLPQEEAYVCRCRMMRGFGGRTVKCEAGNRCAFGEWHLVCLGISEGNQAKVEDGVEWWCPECRVKFPGEVAKGTLLPEESLSLGTGTMTWDEERIDFGGLRAWSDTVGNENFSLEPFE